MSVLIALFFSIPLCHAQQAPFTKRAEIAREVKDTIGGGKQNIKSHERSPGPIRIDDRFLFECILLLALGFVILRGHRQKQKSNKLLEMKNEMIEEQSSIVEQKNKAILNSIHYAKRMQKSILPSELYIEQTLNRLGNKD